VATIIEIPLTPAQASVFSIGLGGTVYNLRLTFNIASGGYWALDIGDEDMNLIVAGIALVSGIDLLAQYAYLGFNGSLVVTTDRGAGEIPTFEGLGDTSHLFFISA
jgi:hypothetical protein